MSSLRRHLTAAAGRKPKRHPKRSELLTIDQALEAVAGWLREGGTAEQLLSGRMDDLRRMGEGENIPPAPSALIDAKRNLAILAKSLVGS